MSSVGASLEYDQVHFSIREIVGLPAVQKGRPPATEQWIVIK